MNTFKDFFICIALIVIGCIIFSFMPDEMGIIGWILFAIGTFLNIVGIFKLASMVPGIQGGPGRNVAILLAVVAAIFIQFFGLLYLYNSGGTGKGLAITTLTLCTSLGLIIYAVDFDDENMKKKIVLVCRIITVFLVAIAIYLMVKDDFSSSAIAVGTILLIEAVATGKIALPKKGEK